MKKVFNKSMLAHVWASQSQLAHVWASQSQDEGRTPTHNFFFEKETLSSGSKSSRHHFIVAKFVKNKKGYGAILFSTRSYSVTTSAQQRLAFDAVRDHLLPVLSCDAISDNDYDYQSIHDKNKKNWLALIADSIKLLGSARNRADEYISEIKNYERQARVYSDFFSLKWKIVAPEFSPEFIAGIKEKNKKAVAKQKHRNELHAKRLARERVSSVKQWLNLEINRIPYELRNGQPVILRLNGDVVQTSEGAEVPASHARKLFPHVQKCHDNGTTFLANGHQLPIGHFSVRRIEANGNVQIGCHYITWPEVERISKQLGV